MPIRISINSRAVPGSGPPADLPAAFGPGPAPRSQGTRLLAGVALLAAALFLLWNGIGFARYAFTGFLWTRTDGAVVEARNSSVPTIRFATPDGVPHTFREDYILLCGGRHSFCWMRNFTPGQVVPVVYDPAAPAHAYVHDWALTANVITWFLEAAAGLFFAFIVAVLLRGRSISFSTRIGSNRE